MLKAWAKSNNYANRKSLSHVMMDGGVLSIPCDKLGDFNRKYIESVVAKEKVFVVEQKTPIYNFFMDLDYKADGQLDLHQVKKICESICDKVNTLGGHRCLVCVANPKMVGDQIKTGIHLNWPGLLVDQEGALRIRSHVVALLNKVYISVKWSSVVDEAVYKGSGFRLPWSHKMSKGVVEDPYMPIAIYESGEGSGQFKSSGEMVSLESHEPTEELLWMATVRTHDESAVATEIPEPPEPLVKDNGFSAAQRKNEFKDTAALAHLETFIRQNMQGQQNARLTKMFKNKSGISVATQSQYCENVQRDHSSNHVWFWVNTKGHICQRCFCTNDTAAGRRRGFCKDFMGMRHQVNPTLMNMLFPDYNKKSANIKKALLPNAVINAGKPIHSNLAPIYTDSFHKPRAI